MKSLKPFLPVYLLLSTLLTAATPLWAADPPPPGRVYGSFHIGLSGYAAPAIGGGRDFSGPAPFRDTYELSRSVPGLGDFAGSTGVRVVTGRWPATEPWPEVIARATVSGEKHLDNLPWSVQAIAIATFDYYAQIVPITPLGQQWVNRTIPMNISVFLHVNGSAKAKVQVRYEGEYLTLINESVETQTGGQVDSISRVMPRNLRVGETIHSTLFADARAFETYKPQALAKQSTAAADPLFEFNQSAFDELMGGNTFLLADNFALVYSPGMIPEPSSAALMMLALAVLSVHLTRRRSRPQVE